MHTLSNKPIFTILHIPRIMNLARAHTPYISNRRVPMNVKSIECHLYIQGLKSPKLFILLHSIFSSISRLLQHPMC